MAVEALLRFPCPPFIRPSLRGVRGLDGMGRATRMAPSLLRPTDGAPHATAKRLEQVPHSS